MCKRGNEINNNNYENNINLLLYYNNARIIININGFFFPICSLSIIIIVLDPPLSVRINK